MAQSHQVISDNYPYLPIHVEVRGQTEEASALLDTGYTGNLVLPQYWLRREMGSPDGRISVQVGDGRRVYVPAYNGTVAISGFPSITGLAVLVMGDEYILGRGILVRYEITLDHGQRVVVRP